jgi:hypothetical protein
MCAIGEKKQFIITSLMLIYVSINNHFFYFFAHIDHILGAWLRIIPIMMTSLSFSFLACFAQYPEFDCELDINPLAQANNDNLRHERVLMG